MLAAMFSDRWAGSHKRDQDGRIFLNYNPYCFDKVLRCLRIKTIDPSYQPLLQQSVDKEHKADWYILLAHLGLLAFMGLHVDENLHFTEGIASNLHTGGYTVEAIPDQQGACKAAPPMFVGKIHFFKCTVLTDAWVFLGVNQAATFECENRLHSTSYGWSSWSLCQGGKFDKSDNLHWQAGDSIVFKLGLVLCTLSMWSTSHPTSWSIPIDRTCVNTMTPFLFFVFRWLLRCVKCKYRISGAHTSWDVCTVVV